MSFPLPWADLDSISPSDFTLHTALRQLDAAGSWLAGVPAEQTLPAAAVEAGHQIAPGRVEAMHEGKRRARARRAAE